MFYRGAEITPSRVVNNHYEWWHPMYTDYDANGDVVWCGHGLTIEDCIAQIDEHFERYEHLNN